MPDVGGLGRIAVLTEPTSPSNDSAMSAPLPPFDGPLAPPEVALEMARLRAALDSSIPRKRPLGRNLLIGTWNLKNFGSLAEKWLAGPADDPKRDFRGLWAVAEIVSALRSRSAAGGSGRPARAPDADEDSGADVAISDDGHQPRKQGSR